MPFPWHRIHPSGSAMNAILVEHPFGTRVEMDESELVAFSGEVDNENEHTTVTGYVCKCHEQVVQRSVHVRLKKSLAMFGEAGGVS